MPRRFGNHILLILAAILPCSSVFISAQVVYNSGNEAYTEAAMLNWPVVVIASGDMEFHWDNACHLYRCGQYVLIPDNTSHPNGRYIDTADFRGYGNNGMPNDNLFAFDAQTLAGGPGMFDKKYLFVSPLSNTGMHYGAVIGQSDGNCVYGSCPVEILGDEAGLAYPAFTPGTGTFDLWLGEELVEAGDLKGTGIVQKASQQQTAYSTHNAYCVEKYGSGWRLPTDIEVGHFNDNEGTGNGFDVAYRGVANCYLWTSSLFIVYNVKRWPVNNITGEWENCAGFLYTQNFVRCVFGGVSNDFSINPSLPTCRTEVFPNPANNILSIQNAPEDLLFIRLCNTNGKVLQTISSDAVNLIDLSCLPSGIYVLHLFLTNNRYFETLKIVKT